VTILFTLLVQGLTLPWLIRYLNAGKDDKRELRRISNIHQKLTKKAIDNMKTMKDIEGNYSTPAKKLVRNYYANRLLQFTMDYESEVDAHVIGDEAAHLLSRILQYERNELVKMLKKRKITDEVYIRILRKIDRDEVGFASYR